MNVIFKKSLCIVVTVMLICGIVTSFPADMLILTSAEESDIGVVGGSDFE